MNPFIHSVQRRGVQPPGRRVVRFGADAGY
jgi:hypothetical protein